MAYILNDDVLSCIFNYVPITIVRLLNRFYNNLMINRYCNQLKYVTGKEVYKYMNNHTILLYHGDDFYLFYNSKFYFLDTRYNNWSFNQIKYKPKALSYYNIDYLTLFNIYNQRSDCSIVLNKYKSNIINLINKNKINLYSKHNYKKNYYCWLVLNKMLLTGVDFLNELNGPILLPSHYEFKKLNLEIIELVNKL